MREITSTDINRELMHMAAQGYAYKKHCRAEVGALLIWQYWCAEMNGDTNPSHCSSCPRGCPRKSAAPPQSRRSPMLKPTPRASASARPS